MSGALHQYSAYGVAIDSEWAMPLPARAARNAHLAAVSFTDASADDFAGIDADDEEPWFLTEMLPDGSRYLRWPLFYECRVDADGGRIRCRPLHGTDRSVMQHFLFGQALSFALLHQGLEPLHAAVVRIDDVAVALIGDCTFGKSTLVASFASAGYPIVTDDLLIAARRNGQIMASPGTGRIKLNPDSARAFLDDGRRGELLNPLATKRSYPLLDVEQQLTPLPLTHVFVLPTPGHRGESARIDARPISTSSLFHELVKNPFNIDVFTRARLERQFANAGALAGRLRGFQLTYPAGFEHLPDVRQCIVDCVRDTRSTSRSIQ